MEQTKEFFSYKGFPLVRNGNQIYYGNMCDEFVVMMNILDTKKVGDVDVATKIKVFKMATDNSLPADKKVVKVVEKTGLYEALDIAYIWLSRATN